MRPRFAQLLPLLMMLLGFAQEPFGDAAQKAQDIRPQDVVQWSPFQATPTADGNVLAELRMTAKLDWSIYADNLSFEPPAGYTVLSVRPPAAVRQLDPVTGKDVDVYRGGDFAVTLAGPTWSGATFPLGVRYVGCTQVICLFPYTQPVELPYVASVAPSLATPPPATPAAPEVTAVTATQIPVDEAPVAPVAPAPADMDLESRLAALFTGGGISFTMLLGIVFLGGLLSNLTPCVYPMIPITLRLLGRQGGSPYASASFYAGGIVATYTVLGMVAAASGGMFGSLLASKTFNLVFAGIMILLGVSMLGFGDFSKLQAIGSRLGSGRPSPRNTFLMGAGAGLVAAPCTGPILAALLAYVAGSDAGFAQSTLLLTIYSVGFALPYVALGGAASKVTAVKVPPSVQIGIKILFAGVMIGLGLYYLRIPFYQVVVQMRGEWGPVAATGLALGLALAAVWVVVPRLQTSKLGMIAPAALLGVGIFAGSQWLSGGRPAGADDTTRVVWIKSEAEGLALAKASQKPILIDMWAEWCEACKKMDVSTFVDPAVVETLRAGWITVKLDLTESTDANDAIHEKYGLQSLPTLVLLPPDGDLAKKQLVLGYVNGATLLTHLGRFRQEAE